MESMNGWELLNLSLTVFGLGVAFWQIFRAKKAADAAVAAAADARSEVHSRLLMSELPFLSQAILSVKDSVARRDFRAASLRICETQSRLFRLSGNGAMETKNRTKIRRTAERIKQVELYINNCETGNERPGLVTEIQQELSTLAGTLDVIYASEFNK